MKKHLHAITLLIGLISHGYGQTIPNGSFEYWTSTTYDLLQNYTAQQCNPQSIQVLGQATMSRVADPYHGNYAIKMETKALGTDTIAGFFINGSPGGSTAPGGIPISQMPTGLNGYYKSGVITGDTAFIIVMFKKNGMTLGNPYFQKFYGAHSTYTPFNLTFSLTTTPDTVIVGASSSYIIGGNFNGLVGSFLQLDSISFAGITSQPPLLNGDFESWSSSSYSIPNAWAIRGDSVAKSTLPYVGSYALKLEVTDNGGYANADEATTGRFSNNGGSYGGYPFTVLNDSVIGYYKLNSIGLDTGSISITTTKNGINVGSGYFKFISNTNYQRFSIPINSSMTPDTMRIDISAGLWSNLNSAMIGSKLWVDGIYLYSSPCTSLSINTLPIPSTLCMGQTTTLSATGANTYTWNTGSNASSIVVTPTASTIYTVSGTSGICSGFNIYTLTVNALPTITAISNNSLLCVGQNATLTANGANTYTWNTNATTSVIVISPTTTTSYTLNGTDVNGCSNFATVTQSVSLCTNINQLTFNDKDITIYPNPFSAKVFINLNKANQTIEVFNIVGKIIFKSIVENEQVELDLSKQPAGIYFVRIGTVTKKIIKE